MPKKFIARVLPHYYFKKLSKNQLSYAGELSNARSWKNKLHLPYIVISVYKFQYL